MPFLDEAAIVGTTSGQPPAAGGVAGRRILSEDSITGRSPQDAALAEINSPVGALKYAGGEFAGRVGGAVGGFVDMFTGILGGIARVPTYIGARVGSTLHGADPKLSGQAAAIGAEEILPEAIHAPFSRISKALGPKAEEYYRDNPIGWINDWIGKAIQNVGESQEKKGNAISEDIVTGFDALMTGLGVVGTKSAVLKAIRDRDMTKLVAAGKKLEQELQAKAALAATEREAAIESMTAGPKELRAAINEAKARKAPTPDEVGLATVGRIFDEAKARTPEQAVAESKARIAAMQAAEATARETAPIGSAVGTVQKGKLSEAPIIGEEPGAPAISPTLESALAKVSADGRALLSAEERIALQDVAQKAGLVDRDGKPISSRQGGAVDPQLMAILGGGAVGAGVVLAAWNYLHPDKKMSLQDIIDRIEGTDMRPDENRTPPKGRETPPWRDVNPPGPYIETMVGAPAVGAAGMVLGRKGMPHPEMVARLAAPLETKLAYDPTPAPAGGSAIARVEAAKAWSSKAISRWLQKPTNEIADVEIPFGDTTAKLGEVMDKALRSARADTFREPNSVGGSAPILEGISKVPPDEQVWGIQGSGIGHGSTGPTRALESYFSHVGDYLRQNVPPEKLGQYDFVRAVKETAANDARVAKEMEKAAGESTAQLPVHKEYPDGYRWVELKLPEKLTAEQAKSVRPMTRHELQSAGMMSTGIGAKGEGYVALNVKGEPIKNGYTDGLAVGKTPAQAKLAGWLSEEGNTMGHCVGGYCEGVASGESRIYSLRDEKGRSHVTVEVAPTGIDRGLGGTGEPAITQIKGKQNRAPDAKYLPYVQDFVKGGKWGEVGDLENTGLRKFEDRYVTVDELAKSDPRAADLWRQRGSADPRLLAGVAATGALAATGAYLGGEDNRTHGAILGAVLGAMGAMKVGRDSVRDIGGTAEKVLGLVSTRLRNISEPLLRQARHFEEGVLVNTHEAIKRVDPFLVTLNKLPAAEKAELNRALLSNEEGKIRGILGAIPGALEQWKEVRATLNEYGQRLSGNAFLSHLREDYFPRIVTDTEGLLSALGKELRTRLDDKLLAAEKQSVRVQGRSLTDLERSAIINQELRAKEATSGRRGFQRERGVEEITTALEPFYASATESLHSYLRNATFELEKAKFFGKDLVQAKAGGVSYVDLDASIGKLLNRQIREGKISGEQIAEVSGILRSRFGPGEQGAAGWIQDARNLANTGLLGNVVSAATQLGDTLMVPFHADLRGTASALVGKLTGKLPASARDFGLLDHLSEEFVSTRSSAKVLNTAFKWGAFTAVDLFGKDVLLNASLAKFQRLADSPRGQAALMKEWGGAFEGDMAQLITDLQGKKMTPLVQELLFNKLSDVQPITKLEVPQAYLDMPNGRVLYMLKTFMLKQLDIARVKGYNEIKKGTVEGVAEGTKNLVAYGTLLGVSGATVDMAKDWLLGRKFDPRWEDIPKNMIKTFGWTDYTLDMAKRGDFTKAVGNIIAPPAQMLDHAIKADPKLWNYLPIAGKLIYPHTEAGELSEAKRQRKIDNRDNPEYQAKLKAFQELKKERSKDPRWKDYYLRRAKGEAVTRPD